MTGLLRPGAIARRSLLRASLGAGIVVLISSRAHLRAAEGAEIAIDNFTFAPTPLTVKVGMSVTWVNHDDIPHSILCPDARIHSHPLDTNDSFTFQFQKAGKFNYICGLHPHMHGQVVVTA